MAERERAVLKREIDKEGKGAREGGEGARRGEAAPRSYGFLIVLSKPVAGCQRPVQKTSSILFAGLHERAILPEAAGRCKKTRLDFGLIPDSRGGYISGHHFSNYIRFSNRRSKYNLVWISLLGNFFCVTLHQGGSHFACGANYPHQAIKGGYFVFVWRVGT